MSPTVIYSNYSAPISIVDNVSEGKLCFYATDLADNTETPIKEAIYVIDRDAPDSNALTLPAYTKSKTFNVAYTTSNSSDLAYVELYYSYNNAPYQKYVTPIYPNGRFLMSPIEFTGLNDGNYKFYTIAVDNLGNTEAIPSTLPDAQTIVDTVPPTPPTILLEAPSFKCNNAHNPVCHTEVYDVLLKFLNNPDYKEIYISGDVSQDSGSTYYNNINRWIPFNTNITIPLDPTVTPPATSKNKTITIKVRDIAGNESSVVFSTFRLWKSAPVINSTDVSVKNCTMFNGICYSDKLNQSLTVSVSTSEENQYYEFFLSGDVSGPNTNTWLLYKNYGGNIDFQITPGDGLKNVTFQVRSPSGAISNSVTKQIKLRQNAPTFNFNVDNSICNTNSTPSLCKTYQTIIPLIITPGEDVYEMYITGNLDPTHIVYGTNVNRWLSFSNTKIVPVTEGLTQKNIFVKVRDIFGHESTEILRRVEIEKMPPSSPGEILHDTSTGDTDGDGMPDFWEIQYGLNPNDPSDAQKDKDNDGLSNLNEYLLGTNPTLVDTDGD